MTFTITLTPDEDRGLRVDQFLGHLDRARRVEFCPGTWTGDGAVHDRAFVVPFLSRRTLHFAGSQLRRIRTSQDHDFARSQDTRSCPALLERHLRLQFLELVLEQSDVCHRRDGWRP